MSHEGNDRHTLSPHPKHDQRDKNWGGGGSHLLQYSMFGVPTNSYMLFIAIMALLEHRSQLGEHPRCDLHRLYMAMTYFSFPS
jgi:hypothetical protein